MTLSGPGGAIARVLDIKTGQVTLERRLHPSQDYHVEPDTLGKDTTFDCVTQDIYTLTNSITVTRLNASTGSPLWTWTSPDQGSLTQFTKILSTPDTIYAVGLSSSFASYTLHVVALSATEGQVLATSGIPSSITKTADLVAFITNDTPHVAWLENGHLKSLQLAPNLKVKTHAAEGEGIEELLDVGLSSSGIFVGQTAKGSVILTVKNGVKAQVERPFAAGNDLSAVYAGATPFIARVSPSPAEEVRRPRES